MASSNSRGPVTAIAVVVVALAAGGIGYYFGMNGTGAASGGGGPAISTAAPAARANDPIQAKANGVPIYKSDVDAFIAELGDQTQQVPPDELRSRVIDRLIDVKLAQAKALEQKIDQDPGIKQRVYTGSMSILADAYLQRAAQARVDDNVLKAKYDELVKQVTPVEEVRARHILVKTEAEAKDIIKQLDKGTDFEKLAKEKSTDPGSAENGGDLGYFTKDKMVPEFADAAFKMDKGQYTKTPVQSQYGWHVIQVVDKRSQPLPAFDQVKPQLTAMVLQEQERKVVDDLRAGAKIEQFNADGSPIVATPAAASAPAPAAAPAPAPAAAPAAAPAPAPAGK